MKTSDKKPVSFEYQINQGKAKKTYISNHIVISTNERLDRGNQQQNKYCSSYY